MLGRAPTADDYERLARGFREEARGYQIRWYRAYYTGNAQARDLWQEQRDDARRQACILEQTAARLRGEL